MIFSAINSFISGNISIDSLLSIATSSPPLVYGFVRIAMLVGVAYIFYKISMLSMNFAERKSRGILSGNVGLFGDIVKHGLFKATLWRRVSIYASVCLLLQFTPMINAAPFDSFVLSLSKTTLVILSGMIAFSVMDCLSEISKARGGFDGFPIKSIVQLCKIIVSLICFTILLSLLIDKSPRYLLTSLGALSAIFMLVFKDSILGVIAGIQLAANKIVAIGDRIQTGDTEGVVEDISLTIVKIRNFDNTITSLPCSELTNKAVKNWASVHDKGRRIKRTIVIDTNSIGFLPYQAALAVMAEPSLMGVVTKACIDDLYKVVDGLATAPVTNVGLYRLFAEKYLKTNDEVMDDEDFVIRLTQSSEHGTPVEVYCFTKLSEWANFESIQSRLFEHLMGVIPQFNLRVFQLPSGHDFQSLRK